MLVVDFLLCFCLCGALGGFTTYGMAHGRKPCDYWSRLDVFRSFIVNKIAEFILPPRWEYALTTVDSSKLRVRGRTGDTRSDWCVVLRDAQHQGVWMWFRISRSYRSRCQSYHLLCLAESGDCSDCFTPFCGAFGDD